MEGGTGWESRGGGGTTQATVGVEPGGGLVGRGKRPQLSQEVRGGSRGAGRAAGGASRVLTTPEVHLLPFSWRKGESVDGWMGEEKTRGLLCHHPHQLRKGQ